MANNSPISITQYVSNSNASNFTISSEADLRCFADLVNNSNSPTDFNGKTIELVNDIALTTAWSPIGNKERRFQGVFDGQDFTISGLLINGGDYVGLFGYVGTDGQIKNVKIENAEIKTDSKNEICFVGCLAGYYASNEAIENCHIKESSIEASDTTSYVGGFVGYIGELVGCVSFQTSIVKSSVKNVNISAKAISGAFAGGLAGYTNAFLAIKDCSVIGNISATATGEKSNSCSGGLVGRAQCFTSIDNATKSKVNVNASANSSVYFSGILVGYQK